MPHPSSPGRPRHLLPGLPRPDRALVMGIVNVTPDSFSDGGRYASAEAAIDHGRQLAAEGADIVDVGGESTRPGAQRPDVATELDRVVPVVRALAGDGLVVSVDTMRAEVADAALDAGAALVNDVSGGLADPRMAAVVAERGCAYVCMHWRAHSAAMQSAEMTTYADVAVDVATELRARVQALTDAGVPRHAIALDPGLGFSKAAGQNWELLAGLDAVHEIGLPVLVGASRKTFLGALLADGDTPRPASDRDDASTAVATLAAFSGAWAIRSHAVRPVADAVRVVAAWGAAAR